MDSLNSSTSQGLSPKARQIRWIVVGESPTCLGQFPLGPVRGPLGRLLQGPHHHLLDLRVGDRARHAGPGSSLSPANRSA